MDLPRLHRGRAVLHDAGRMSSFVRTLAVIATLATLAAGCHRDGCIGGDDGKCVPAAACPALTYACPASGGSPAAAGLAN